MIFDKLYTSCNTFNFYDDIYLWRRNTCIQLHDTPAERFAKLLLNIMTIDGSALTDFFKITATTDELIHKIFSNIAYNYKDHSSCSSVFYSYQKQRCETPHRQSENKPIYWLNQGEIVNCSNKFLNSLDLPDMPLNVHWTLVRLSLF